MFPLCSSFTKPAPDYCYHNIIISIFEYVNLLLMWLTKYLF